jgi:hypothetical protein
MEERVVFPKMAQEKLNIHIQQNKQKCHFFNKNREQEGRTGPSWGGQHQWEEGGCRERVYEGEHSANIVYTYMSMEN